MLWAWLSNRPVSGYPEERLLWRMLENTGGAQPDHYFQKAEQLAGSGDPRRAYTLGWIMNRLRFPERSLPLLRRAVETATDKELKERAAFALFESFLDTGDWKGAERIFPEASRQLPGAAPNPHLTP